MVILEKALSDDLLMPSVLRNGLIVRRQIFSTHSNLPYIQSARKEEKLTLSSALKRVLLLLLTDDSWFA